MTNKATKLIATIVCAIFCTACTTNTLKIEVAPDTSLTVQKPDRLKLVEGIFAQYKQGSIFIDTQYMKNGMTGDSFLKQIYGSDQPLTPDMSNKRKIALADSKTIKDVSKGTITGYYIQHKGGYDLLVFAINSKNFVTYLTGKNIPVIPVYSTIKER